MFGCDRFGLLPWQSFLTKAADVLPQVGIFGQEWDRQAGSDVSQITLGNSSRPYSRNSARYNSEESPLIQENHADEIQLYCGQSFH
jgi:hypothetical protein